MEFEIEKSYFDMFEFVNDLYLSKKKKKKKTIWAFVKKYVFEWIFE
jgi:hypothetical protein